LVDVGAKEEEPFVPGVELPAMERGVSAGMSNCTVELSGGMGD